MNTLISTLHNTLTQTGVILAQSISYLNPLNVISKFVKRDHVKTDNETISTKRRIRTGSHSDSRCRKPNQCIFRKRITKTNVRRPLKTSQHLPLDPVEDSTTFLPEMHRLLSEVSDFLRPSHNQEPHSRKRKNMDIDETDRKRRKIDSDSSPDNESGYLRLDKDMWRKLAEIDIRPYEKVPWIPKLGLTLVEKIALTIPNCPLNCKVVDAAQILLKQQFITEGLQSSETPWYNMQPVSGPAVQIHADTEKNHCFTSCYRNGQVEIAHVLPLQVSRSVLMQIETIYENVVADPLNYVAYLDVEAQPEGSNDCVLYAIALAYEILNNGDLSCTFDISKMRAHLFKCFMCQEITEFPKISKIS